MIVVLMGVSGSGKTTIGELLAKHLGWRFIEGDDYHPKENIDKMAAGIPLEDADRWPWLEALNQRLRGERGRERLVARAALELRRPVAAAEVRQVDRLLHLQLPVEDADQRLGHEIDDLRAAR